MEARSTIAEKEEEIVEAFSMFEDWMGRYEYLIDLGRSLPPLDEAYKTDDYLIRGCQSQVWVRPVLRDGRIYYEGDSDALITRGLVALLVEVLSGQPPEAVASADLAFLERIGMQEHLSPTRKNGLASMIRQMKLYAAAAGAAA